MTIRSMLSVFAAAMALASCRGAEGLFAPTGGAVADLAKLDGGFRGNATFARGPDSCARQFAVALEVRNGQMQGEIRDPRVPNASPSRFDGFLETDGGLATIVRAGGEVLVLRGRFLETRFDGTMVPEASIDPRRDNPRPGESNLRFGVSQHCMWLVRASRQPA